ncbi:hypothetical protein DENSPDRAFT_844825 [Dentipellis sp. KUC8613]|nr:hypothetical protein DENSPDRAFT_844825 [Dentipellis sp. KUC8613]
MAFESLTPDQSIPPDSNQPSLPVDTSAHSSNTDAVTPNSSKAISRPRQITLLAVTNYSEATIRDLLPISLYPPSMRPDNVPKFPTEDELRSTKSFLNLPECLMPASYSKPPHLDYGCRISDDQLIAFSRLDDAARGRSPDPEPFTPGGTLKIHTFKAAERYLSAAVGCRVAFRDVWNAAPGLGVGEGYVMAFCDNYHARTCSRVIRIEHALKLAELLGFPLGTMPRWYINAVEHTWELYEPRLGGY